MGLFKKKQKEKAEKLPNIPNAGGCIVTKSVLAKKTRMKWVFREESVNPADNGWRVIGENDTQEYLDDSNNLTVCDFNTLIEIEPIIYNIYEMPVGADLEIIRDASGTYFIDTKTGKEIREKVKSLIQTAFEENLKFISKDTMDAKLVKRVFEEDKRIRYFTFADCSFSSGRVIVADPLCYLQDPKSISVLEKKIPAGKYPVTLAVMDSEIAGRRIVGARLKVTDAEAVSYELAAALRNDNGETKPTFAGFPVETGLGSFLDQEAAVSYWNFLAKWYAVNKDKNLYDDYFAELFAESYESMPDFQREGGDFLRWTNPEDGTQIAMFSSGLGDGFYSDYWGLDAQGEICELVVVFMNPELF